MAFCTWSPPESALYASLNPKHVPDQMAVLALIEWHLHWLKWVKTKDGQRGHKPPEPLGIIKPPAEADEYVPMTVDEMDAFLGRSFRN